jgi:hypothetical protein
MCYKSKEVCNGMKIQMKSLSKFEAFIMKIEQNQDSLIIVAKVRKDIISTVYYVILIGQLCKWLKIGPKLMFTLMVSSDEERWHPSGTCIFGNSFSNMLFQEATLK